MVLDWTSNFPVNSCAPRWVEKVSPCSQLLYGDKAHIRQPRLEVECANFFQCRFTFGELPDYSAIHSFINDSFSSTRPNPINSENQWNISEHNCWAKKKKRVQRCYFVVLLSFLMPHNVNKQFVMLLYSDAPTIIQPKLTNHGD